MTQPSKASEAPSSLYDENYFLNLAGGSDLYAQTQGKKVDPRARRVLDLMSLSSNSKCLDVGCGRGELLKAICGQQVALAIGIDYACTATKIAARTLIEEMLSGCCGLQRANAISLPFVNEAFDFVTMTDVVEHLQPWQLSRCLNECRRVLRRSGKLLIHTFPNRLCWDCGYPLLRAVTNLWRTNEAEKLPKNPRADYDPILHVNEQSPYSLKRALQKAGFSSVKVWLEFSSITPHIHFLARGGSRKREFLFRVISLPVLRSLFYNDIYAMAIK